MLIIFVPTNKPNPPPPHMTSISLHKFVKSINLYNVLKSKDKVVFVQQLIPDNELELRKKFAKLNLKFTSIPEKYPKKFLANTEFHNLNKLIQGPTTIVYSTKNNLTFADLDQINKTFPILTLYWNRRFYGVDEILEPIKTFANNPNPDIINYQRFVLALDTTKILQLFRQIYETKTQTSFDVPPTNP